ncbi:MAG TPA: hypothetical protein VI818_05590 [Candidatus Thermoplasmatota archaeon]|nr:hypothetical protein [Candidatus Thermoplasmatota archaeon]
MRRERLLGWLTRHRDRWLGATVAGVVGYELFALWFFGGEWRPYEWMVLWLVPPAWILGIAFAAGLETVRPIHAEPTLDRTWTRMLHVLLLFPFSILFAILIILAFSVGAAGLDVDLNAQTAVNLFAGMLVGPVTIGMLIAGWFILERRGTLRNRVWFVLLFCVGVALVAVLSQVETEWIAGETATAGLPFIWAALAIAMYRIWRAPPLPPEEATISLGPADAPTFHRARF